MKFASLKRIADLWTISLLWIACLSGVSGSFDANFTLQNVWGRLQSDSRSIIQCLSDDNYKKIKFSRKLDTGQGARLPKLSQQFMQAKPVFARILFMPDQDKLNRFGVFQCKILKENVATEIVTLKLPPSNLAELDAVDPYKVASVGDTVELEVNITKKLELPVKWRHNGVHVPSWDDQLMVEIEDVQPQHAGIYECFYEGRRKEGVHALMRLIVRKCAENMYGDKCDQECPPCYNGGICHDSWGVCVCPAGFMGPNCEDACGGNHFGADCTKLCTPPQNNSNTDELCASHLFCKPDPYGCSCAPGFKGSSCMEHCEPGWYGADCKEPCHCAHGISSCNRITGACAGGCARNWRGNSCQIEDPNANNTMETTTMVYCPLGLYGPSCERECHCAGNEHCNVVTGLCPSGCEEGWGGHTCGSCRPGRFGDNCEFNCHCEGGHHNCDKDGFCHGGCEAGWAGFTCQTECTPGRFGTNCASTCHCHGNSTLPCDKITGVCEGDCEAGYMGEDCQTMCPQHQYGVNCIYECVCLNGGHCSRIDGSCDCEGRWKGLTCNESEPQIVAAADEEVNAGQQVYISCTADAIPEPVMNISSSLQDNGEDLKVKLRTLEQNQYQAVVKVKPKDPGQLEFTCSAKNVHGFDMKKIILSVIEAPKLTTSPWLLSKTNVSLTLGWRDWEFAKDIGGSATDKIEYMIMYRQEDASTWEKVDGWSTEVSNTVGELTPNTLYEVAIKCRRLGKGGEGGMSPGLFIRTECGVPTAEGLAREVLPHLITESTVTLIWKKPFEGPLRCALKGYYLSYHPEADESILQSIELDADANTTQLEDLSPNTAYVVRLYAITEVERSKYFVELSIRTSDTIPDPVTQLECRSVDDQPGLLVTTWEAPSEVNGAIRGYVINYTLTDRGHCGQLKDAEDTSTRQLLSDDTEITLSNLHPYSIYNVTVQARTSVGESDPVSVLAATAEDEPDEAPPNVRVISSTSHSLEFRWDPVPCEHANGIITHYEYMVIIPEDIYPLHLRMKRTLDVPVPNSSLHIVEGLQTEVKNLQPDTEYGFMVRGVNRAGGGRLSDVMFYRTNEDIPGQPLELTVISVSSLDMGLFWKEPEVPNGKVSQYRIQFWDHDTSNLAADVIYNVTNDHDGTFTTFVKGLAPATDFFIKIQAATSAGWGDFCSPISGRTLDGIPGEPSEISVTGSGLTTLNLTWQEPAKKNGDVLGYKIRYRPMLTLDPVFNTTPFDEKETEVDDASIREITLSDLHPSTEYDISASARTDAGYGPEASVQTWTVILGDHVSPSLRTLDVEVTNETIPIAFSTTGSTSVYKYQVIVEDARNEEPIDENLLSDYETAVVKNKLPYYIAAELDPRNVSRNGEQFFVVGDQKVWGGYRNVHLNPGHEYKIRIRTLVFKDDEIKTVLSEPEKESAAPSVVQVHRKYNPKVAGFDLIPFILILIGLIVFIIAATFLTVYAVCRSRRRKKASSASTHEFGRSESLTFSVMYRGPDSETVGGPIVNEGYKTLPIGEKHASLRKTRSDSKIARGLRIESLQDFVTNALATYQLTEEFQRLVEGQTSPWTIARKSCNLKKNRYGNILPYDKHRVVLLTNSKNESDYINASYIDGYRRCREYIITQGPLDHTVNDFWRMVWQENVPAIVMVTDLVENGKKKCTKYWPDDSMMCGDIQILNIHSEESTDFVVRTILMRKLDEISTHRVQQYQFTAWPDRTVPLNTNYFIKFLKRVREDHPIMAGPMIVHCSAGAGRSGTFVAIDALYQQATEERRVEVFRYVNTARHQRIHLVQTLEQYIFIYEALVEAHNYEDTSVPLEKIGSYLKELNHMSTLDHRALILKQYNKLNRTQKTVEKNRCSVALSEDNIFRNRDPMIVPLDAARVRLQSVEQPAELADYINAIFVDGYRKKNAYLATQMPLTHTTEDFWRMIYEHKSPLIVMLNGSDDTDDLNVGVYWPDLDGCSYGDFDVELITSEEQGDFITRILRLTHCESKTAEPHMVIQLQYKGWSSELKPESMIKLLQYAEACYQKSSEGPITVHCMDGATRTGLFIAARNVCDQIKTEETLDVYQVVKSIRTNRPEFVPNSDQYRFLFEIAQELVCEWSEC